MVSARRPPAARKRYLRLHYTPIRTAIVLPGVALVPSAEDQDVGDAFMRELVAAGEERWVAGTVLETIIRSRVGGESITDLAAEHASRKVLLRRRWWAETRLRELPLAGVSSRRRVGLALRWGGRRTFLYEVRAG